MCFKLYVSLCFLFVFLRCLCAIPNLSILYQSIVIQFYVNLFEISFWSLLFRVSSIFVIAVILSSELFLIIQRHWTFVSVKIVTVQEKMHLFAVIYAHTHKYICVCVYIYIYIYIVIHRQICFVLSELISVARQYLPVAGIETRLTQTPNQSFQSFRHEEILTAK